MGKYFRGFVERQQRLCWFVDRALPASFTVTGTSHFRQVVIPAHVAPGMVVCDVGGGKHPFFSFEQKVRLRLKVHAIDITEQELAAAPPGAYDRVSCGDICSYVGESNADLVVCQAVLEHVNDSNAAIRGLASLLKPGAAALVWVPCGNALFARLNRILPESWKRKILFTIFPQTQQAHGFPAYYDRCTPRDFIRMAEINGLQVEAIQSYYMNRYFSFFLPAHLLWRMWQLLARCVVGDQACEAFSVVLRKPQTLEVSSMASAATSAEPPATLHLAQQSR